MTQLGQGVREGFRNTSLRWTSGKTVPREMIGAKLMNWGSLIVLHGTSHKALPGIRVRKGVTSQHPVHIFLMALMTVFIWGCVQWDCEHLPSPLEGIMSGLRKYHVSTPLIKLLFIFFWATSTWGCLFDSTPNHPAQMGKLRQVEERWTGRC